MKIRFDLFKDLLISIILSFIYSVFLDIFKANFDSMVFCILCSMLLSISCTVILIYIFYLLLYGRFKFVRRLFNPLATYEGTWICHTGIAERPVSIFEIQYDSVNHCYIYLGNAYDSNSDYKGDWQSQGGLIFENNMLRFYATGHFVDSDGNLCSNESSGYIVLRKNKSHYTANGYIIDWCANNGCYTAHSEKVTKKFLRDNIGCKDFSPSSIKKLVLYYADK